LYQGIESPQGLSRLFFVLTMLQKLNV